MVLYVGLMIHLGRRGQRQVASADDFAVARGAYGPLTLAVAYAATAASGATFLGLPGLAYQYGMGVYAVLGGAHADIMTDAVQGAIMLGIAVMVGRCSQPATAPMALPKCWRSSTRWTLVC